MKPAGNGNKKRKNQWKKRRWQWKEACTLSWTRHSQKGVQPPRWPYPGTWAGGSNPWLTLPRDLAGGILGQFFFLLFLCFFFLLFPREKKKRKKKTKKKNEKKTIWEDPPFQTRGSPQVSSHLHHHPESAKFPPNLAKVHVPRRLVTIRGILFHLQAPKVGWHSQRKRLQVFFCCFFPIVFFCFFVCFFLFFFYRFFFVFFSKWLNRFFLFF